MTHQIASSSSAPASEPNWILARLQELDASATPDAGSAGPIWTVATGEAPTGIRFFSTLCRNESFSPSLRRSPPAPKRATTTEDVIAFLQRAISAGRLSLKMAFNCLQSLAAIFANHEERFGVPFERYPRVVLTNDDTLAIFFAFGHSRFEVEFQGDDLAYYAFRGRELSDEQDETCSAEAPIPRWFLDHALEAKARES